MKLHADCPSPGVELASPSLASERPGRFKHQNHHLQYLGLHRHHLGLHQHAPPAPPAAAPPLLLLPLLPAAPCMSHRRTAPLLLHLWGSGIRPLWLPGVCPGREGGVWGALEHRRDLCCGAHLLGRRRKGALKNKNK